MCAGICVDGLQNFGVLQSGAYRRACVVAIQLGCVTGSLKALLLKRWLELSAIAAHLWLA